MLLNSQAIYNAMKRLPLILLVITFTTINALSQIDTVLVEELKQMLITDQIAAHASPTPEYGHLTRAEWKNFKDSVFRDHQERLEEILDTMGYPGYTVVGRSAESWFWVMVQHSDHDPEFQQRVLNAMEIEIKKGNATPSNYAYLTDRVKLNTGGQQVYGTQVNHNLLTGAAKPKDLMDPENVDMRRAEIGLGPLEDYLAEMTESHMASTLTGVVTNPTLILLVIPAIVAAVSSMLFRIKRRKKFA